MVQHIIRGWSFQNLLLEYYCYAPCPAEWLRLECHSEYQICLSLNYPGQYRYRGSHHWVPAGSLSIIHPGEMHCGRDIDDRQTNATFRLLYLDSSKMQQVAESIDDSFRVAQSANHLTSLPFFPLIIIDQDLAQRFLAFHLASTQQTSRLEQDALLLDFSSTILRRYATDPPEPRQIQPERQAIRRVRDYLHDRASENVSLDRLAQISELSSYYLSRVFRAEMSVTLQRYQTQVRIERAKQLLVRGMEIWQVAIETGFVDQSHFTHQFRQIVRTTPGKYRLGRI